MHEFVWCSIDAQMYASMKKSIPTDHEKKQMRL